MVTGGGGGPRPPTFNQEFDYTDNLSHPWTFKYIGSIFPFFLRYPPDINMYEPKLKEMRLRGVLKVTQITFVPELQTATVKGTAKSANVTVKSLDEFYELCQYLFGETWNSPTLISVESQKVWSEYVKVAFPYSSYWGDDPVTGAPVFARSQFIDTMSVLECKEDTPYINHTISCGSVDPSNIISYVGFGVIIAYLHWTEDNKPYIKWWHPDLWSHDPYGVGDRGALLGCLADHEITQRCAISVQVLPRPVSWAYEYPRTYLHNLDTSITIDSYQWPPYADPIPNVALFLIDGTVVYDESTTFSSQLEEYRTFLPVRIDGNGNFTPPPVYEGDFELTYKASQIDIPLYTPSVSAFIYGYDPNFGVSNSLVLLEVEIDEEGRIKTASRVWEHAGDDPCSDYPNYGLCSWLFGGTGTPSLFIYDADGNVGNNVEKAEDVVGVTFHDVAAWDEQYLPEVKTYYYGSTTCDFRAEIGFYNNSYDGKVWYFDPGNPTEWLFQTPSGEQREGDEWYIQIEPPVFTHTRTIGFLVSPGDWKQSDQPMIYNILRAKCTNVDWVEIIEFEGHTPTYSTGPGTTTYAEYEEDGEVKFAACAYANTYYNEQTDTFESRDGWIAVKAVAYTTGGYTIAVRHKGDFQLKEAFILMKNQAYFKDNTRIWDEGTGVKITDYVDVPPTGNDLYPGLGAPVSLPGAVDCTDALVKRYDGDTRSIFVPASNNYSQIQIVNGYVEFAHADIHVWKYDHFYNNHVLWCERKIDMGSDFETDEGTIISLTAFSTLSAIDRVALGVGTIKLPSTILAPPNNMVVFDSITPVDL